jgi:hypothetical protein
MPFNLLKFWVRNAQPPQFLGALLDDRSVEEKKNDIRFEHIVGSATEPVWKELTLQTARTFPTLNQYQSFTCGANAYVKSLGILFFTKYGVYLPFSREHVYMRRFNRPDAGMTLYDMFRIGQEGVTLEQFVKTSAMTDEDFDGAKVEPWMNDVGKSFSIANGVYLNNDIDTIASVIQTTGKGVILMTFFLAGEWSTQIPFISQYIARDATTTLRHFVTAVDAILYKGKKYLVIEDSSWFGGYNRRLLSEEWVLNRIAGAGYPMRFKFQEGTGVKPIYDGVTVVSAQQCLRYEGLFPTNVSFIESFGPVTRKAVGDFQAKYKLKVTQALDQSTKNMLSKLYL